jgi:hypothetical protein
MLDKEQPITVREQNATAHFAQLDPHFLPQSGVLRRKPDVLEWYERQLQQKEKQTNDRAVTVTDFPATSRQTTFSVYARGILSRNLP